MLVPNKNPERYKENFISFIRFSFEECVTIIYWPSNMKLYVSDIEESYKDTIVGNLGNSGASDLLLNLLKCWCTCAVNE